MEEHAQPHDPATVEFDESDAQPSWPTEEAFVAHLDDQASFDYDAHYYRSALEFELPEPSAKGEARPLPKAAIRPGKTRALSDVKAESISWLWPGRIALGSVTILDGDPGVGKTTLVIDLAARISRGWAMPLEEKPMLPPSCSLIVSAEDNPAITIKPRADAACADLSKVFVALDHCWLPVEAPKLQQMIHDTNARFVVLDPGVAFFDQKIDTNSDAQVRRAISGLSDIAAATRSAILFVRHLNKAQRSAAMYRGGGSIAIAAAARNCLLARVPGRNQSPILASYKANLSAPPKTLAYDVIEDPDLRVSKIRWVAKYVDISADEALASDAEYAKRKKSNVDPTTKATRAAQLEDDIVKFLLEAGPTGMQPSQLRTRLRVKQERLYEALTNLMTAQLIHVDGNGPQRKYVANPMPEGPEA